jgi:hypothetical protein
MANYPKKTTTKKTISQIEFTEKFFKKRFGKSPSDNPTYFKEWLRRIEYYPDYQLERVMDEQSWNTYQTLKKQYNIRSD